MTFLEKDIEYFELLLKNHDWHFEYSDDPVVFLEGNRVRNKIMVLYKRLIRLDAPQTIEMFNKYSPRKMSVLSQENNVECVHDGE